MADVKEHPMFEGLDWGEFRAKRLPAPWVPSEEQPLLDWEKKNSTDAAATPVCAAAGNVGTDEQAVYEGEQVKTDFQQQN